MEHTAIVADTEKNLEKQEKYHLLIVYSMLYFQ